MSGSKYFDFHFHPVFKNFITSFDNQYPSPRSAGDIIGKVHLEHSLIRIMDQKFLHLLHCQSCIYQLKKAGELVLGMAAIASIEKCFSATRGLFAKILTSRGRINPLDHAYMDKIREGDISYYYLFIKELELYKKLRDHNYITILTRKKQTSLDCLRGIALTLSMEGGHCLCRTKIKNPGEYDDTPEIDQSDAFYEDFRLHKKVDSARSLQLLQQAMWDEDMDLLYLTLTHLSFIKEAHLAGHAYGMKMIKEPSIYPAGHGLTQKGKDVIDAAYELKVNVKGKSVAAPVLIDIKHMSLKSRLDFYEYRKGTRIKKSGMSRNEKDFQVSSDPDFQNSSSGEKSHAAPIIATHAGVTGYSIQEWINSCQRAFMPRKLKEKVIGIKVKRKLAGEWGGMHKKFTFNAWSINLMDEDIVEIMRSRGLIGVSLDVRILGWQDAISKGGKIEYISTEDFAYFFPGQKTTTIPSVVEEEFLEEKVKSKAPAPSREERQPLSFCFNILHIISTGLQVQGVDPWERVCIGSDFDGMINPLINCRNAGRFPGLEKSLIKWLPVAERSYRSINNGPELLKKTDRGEVDTDDLKQKIRNIMYLNGKQFVESWLAYKL